MGSLIYGLPKASAEVASKLQNDLMSFLQDFNEIVNGKFVCGKNITISDIFAFNEIIALQLTSFNYLEYKNIVQ